MTVKKGKWLVIFMVLAMLITLAPAVGGAVNNVREGATKEYSDFMIMSTGLSTTDLTDPDLNAADLVEFLLADDPGINIVDVSIEYIGANSAAGTFTGGDGIIGFDQGIILSTGNIASVVGPNTFSDISTDHNLLGDPDLTTLSGFTTHDAAVLQFEFETEAEMVYFSYVFASEEYNEYVGSQFNDVFAFFVNKVNYALINDNPVSVNTINNGSQAYNKFPTNPDYYINNDPFNEDYYGNLIPENDRLNTEMDGLTVVLTFAAPVKQGTNTMKLAIADASDGYLDSNVFIQAGSFSIKPPEPEPEPEPECERRTQGYWKNHPEMWPAFDSHPEIETCGTQDDFFGQGAWMEVLWTPPRGGDAYYILAHQFIAAFLNVQSGCLYPKEVGEALYAAGEYFHGGGVYGEYGEPGALTGRMNKDKRDARAAVLGWAEILDNWNNGL